MAPTLGAVEFSEIAKHALATPAIVLTVLYWNRHRRTLLAEKILDHRFALPGLKVLDKAAAVCSGVLVTTAFRHDWNVHPIWGTYFVISALGFFSVPPSRQLGWPSRPEIKKAIKSPSWDGRLRRMREKFSRCSANFPWREQLRLFATSSCKGKRKF